MLIPVIAEVAQELPPRARRIPADRRRRRRATGTTSACAENTRFSQRSQSSPWNYLRVRGEYAQEWEKQQQNLELPPRARRIPQLVMTPTGTHGTTSACAENTTPARTTPIILGNYLRVRGEYPK